MARPAISLGDTVLIQMYNTASGRRKRVGEAFHTTVQDIEYQPRLLNSWQRDHPWLCIYKILVGKPDGYPIWVWRYEVVHRCRYCLHKVENS
jgi:hypothetical protein